MVNELICSIYEAEIPLNVDEGTGDLILCPYRKMTLKMLKTKDKWILLGDSETVCPPQKNPSYIRASDQTDQLVPIDPYLFLIQRETIREDLDRLPRPLHQKRGKLNLDEAIPCILMSEEGAKKYRKNWARLIQKIGACPRLDRGRRIP